MQNQNRKCFKNITFWYGCIQHSPSSFFSDCTLFNNGISQYQRGLLNLRHDLMLLMNTLAFLLDNHSCQSRKSTEFPPFVQGLHDHRLVEYTLHGNCFLTFSSLEESRDFD